GEHHPQQIVLDRVRKKELLDGRRERPFTLEQPPQLRGERAGRPLPPQDVERTVLRGGHEPRGGILGNPPELPHLQRAAEGVLYDVFRQRQVLDPEDARERGDEAPRFAPEQMLRRLDHMLSFMAGRTSTVPSFSRIGQPFESSTACARSRASITV